MTHEQPLAGSMDPRYAPVRVGDTVRRPAGSSRAAVRDLLLHLESVGFDGAPRHLGTDELGREVLTWIDGDVPLPPYPAWAMTDRALTDLGQLVRRFHEATATFRSTTDDWSTQWADPAGGSVVCHNDLFPENVVFRDGRVVALIDFAMAAPGRPLWDVAIAAEIWGPLGDPERRDPHGIDLDGIARLGVLARAYGLKPDSAERTGRRRRTGTRADPRRTSGPRSRAGTSLGSMTGRRPAATIVPRPTTPGSLVTARPSSGQRGAWDETHVLGGAGGFPPARGACSGYLIEHDGFRLLVDPGYAIVPRLLEILPPEAIDAVLVSHGHPDHVADLNPLLRARLMTDDEAPPLPAYALPDALSRVLALDQITALKGACEVHEFAAGDAFPIGPFAIESRLLPHSIPNAGVRISAGGSSITYTGDAGPTDDLVALATGTDLLLAEATYVESVPSGNEGVLNSALVVGHQARWAGAARLMLTHLLPGTDPEASRAAAGRFFDDWIAVATPGTIVEL